MIDKMNGTNMSFNNFSLEKCFDNCDRKMPTTWQDGCFPSGKRAKKKLVDKKIVKMVKLKCCEKKYQKAKSKTAVHRYDNPVKERKYTCPFQYTSDTIATCEVCSSLSIRF
jgi:hypothetical protein